MRKNAISIELNNNAKEIYNKLPREVKKGEWVSNAIIEYDNKKDIFTVEQIQWIMDRIAETFEEIDKRIEKLEKRMEEGK